MNSLKLKALYSVLESLTDDESVEVYNYFDKNRYILQERVAQKIKKRFSMVAHKDWKCCVDSAYGECNDEIKITHSNNNDFILVYIENIYYKNIDYFIMQLYSYHSSMKHLFVYKDVFEYLLGLGSKDINIDIILKMIDSRTKLTLKEFKRKLNTQI